MQKGGATPLDFIKKNLGTIDASPPPTTVTVPNPNGTPAVTNPAQNAAQSQAPTEPVPNPLLQRKVDEILAVAKEKGLIPNDNPPDPSNPQVQTQTTDAFIDPVPFGEKPQEPSSEAAQADASDPELDEEVENPAAENFKKLRTKAKEYRSNYTETKKKLDETETRLKRYETGEIVSDVLIEKDKEITRLKPFEQLFNLKGSPEYTEQILAPMDSAKSRIKDIFKGYGIQEQDLDRALEHTLKVGNEAVLNKFLSDNGIDAIGATDIKNSVATIKDLTQRSVEAERAPGTYFEKLKTESATAKEAAKRERIHKGEIVAKDAWKQACFRIREDGKIPTLIPRHNDKAYNDSIVTPTLTRAMTEYQRVIQDLFNGGLAELTPELALYFANMTLLGHSSVHTSSTAHEALEEANELRNNSKRIQHMIRPSVGGGTPRSAPAASATPVIPPLKEDIRNHMNNILQGSKT